MLCPSFFTLIVHRGERPQRINTAGDSVRVLASKAGAGEFTGGDSTNNLQVAKPGVSAYSSLRNGMFFQTPTGRRGT
jgi:hypothetical protein